MISYDCLIFDTNTHCFYTQEEYERITVDTFPQFKEFHKPQTKKVFIGSHSWLGHGATILKGAHLANGSIVGARTIFTDTTQESEVAVSPKAIILKSKHAST
jgi:acetyltransferase-like isoleucine patch superfamily enzyme